MLSASSTSSVRRWFAIAQPTTRRLHASTTTARYRNPAHVGTYVMSATQSWSGPGAPKSRSTRSGAGRASRSRLVVHASPSTRDPLDPGPAHEPTRDPLATDRYAIGGELGMDPRNPVGPSRALMDLHDPVLQRLVRAGSRGRLPLAPRVVAAGGDPQRAAHAFHGELGPVVAHELERPRGVDPVS